MLGVKEGIKDKGCEVFLSRHPASVSGEAAHTCLERQSTLFFFLTFLSIYLFVAALVFVAVRWLSLAAASMGSSCGLQAPHCGGFSCCGARAQ